jgi:hypothetical protein
MTFRSAGLLLGLSMAGFIQNRRSTAVNDSLPGTVRGEVLGIPHLPKSGRYGHPSFVRGRDRAGSESFLQCLFSK